MYSTVFNKEGLFYHCWTWHEWWVGPVHCLELAPSRSPTESFKRVGSFASLSAWARHCLDFNLTQFDSRIIQAARRTTSSFLVFLNSCSGRNVVNRWWVDALNSFFKRPAYWREQLVFRSPHEWVVHSTLFGLLFLAALFNSDSRRKGKLCCVPQHLFSSSHVGRGSRVPVGSTKSLLTLVDARATCLSLP